MSESSSPIHISLPALPQFRAAAQKRRELRASVIPTSISIFKPHNRPHSLAISHSRAELLTGILDLSHDEIKACFVGYNQNDFQERTTPLHRLREEIEKILAQDSGRDHLANYLQALRPVAPLKVFTRSRIGKTPKFCNIGKNGLVTGVELMALDKLKETLPSLLGNIKQALFSRSISTNLVIQNAARTGLEILGDIVSPVVAKAKAA